MNLKELSAKLGLSQTTVSRALNGYPEVSQSTRDRVAQAAARYGYRPNPRAKGLAVGRAFAIGHVIQSDGPTEIVNPIFGDFIAGAGAAYSQAGYEMVLSVVSDGDEAATYKALKARGAVDGVVLSGPLVTDPRIPLLQDIGLPFVVHGQTLDQVPDYDWVDVDNFEAFRSATTHLIDLGHRRIALINGHETMTFAHLRREGYLHSLEAAGIAPDPALMFSSDMTEEIGFRSCLKMLDADQPPTAFVVSSMISALGVRRAIEGRGLTMGRDISVVIHDDALSYLQNGSDRPIFTATRSSVRDAGREVADMLIRRIEDPTLPPQHLLLSAALVQGGSSGPALA
ncbi:LacI family DNA-binding transcriptional regulator [Loktanella sp. IMCC34160]|uniref:substrate-binding domain-containing protein n=1 Tax=Loktanella sp. IMCC34160 TaxID=2510646 RepID=UPI00101DF3C4|nr:substrate-binding domain-containing protein [Loktanella sp. IMCC34160]RYG92425.1 LacI family DNA-binding transcriptional regulator [Loktanella sp. IMCC34160]